MYKKDKTIDKLLIEEIKFYGNISSSNRTQV